MTETEPDQRNMCQGKLEREIKESEGGKQGESDKIYCLVISAWA